jgi:hypothetical protein
MGGLTDRVPELCFAKVTGQDRATAEAFQALVDLASLALGRDNASGILGGYSLERRNGGVDTPPGTVSNQRVDATTLGCQRLGLPLHVFWKVESFQRKGGRNSSP